MDKTLAEGQPAANRHAHAEPASFEREEPRDGLASGQDGNMGIRLDPVYGSRELRRQERVSQERCGILHGMPRRDLGRPEIAWADEMYGHRILSRLPGQMQPGSRFILKSYRPSPLSGNEAAGNTAGR